MPVASLALARSPPSRSRALRWVLVVALLVLVAADLRVSIYEAAAAEPGSARYAGLTRARAAARAAGAAPDVHLGSVYLGTTRSPRERPAAARRSRRSRGAALAAAGRLNCATGGLATTRCCAGSASATSPSPRPTGENGWFAWREPLGHGFGQVARDDGVTMLERGRSGGSSPCREPSKRIVFCEGSRERLATLPPRRLLGRGQPRPPDDPRAVRVTLSIHGEAGPLAARDEAGLDPVDLLISAWCRRDGLSLAIASPGIRGAALLNVVERLVPPARTGRAADEARRCERDRRAQLRDETGYIGVYGDQVFTQVLEFGFKHLRRAELDKAVGGELESVVPVDLEDMVYSSSSCQSVAGAGPAPRDRARPRGAAG